MLYCVCVCVCVCVNLQGSICDDVMCVVFCPCCSAIQMGMELKQRCIHVV